MSEEEKDKEEKEELPLSEGLQKRTTKKSMMSVARGCSDLTNSSSDRKKGNFINILGIEAIRGYVWQWDLLLRRFASTSASPSYLRHMRVVHANFNGFKVNY